MTRNEAGHGESRGALAIEGTIGPTGQSARWRGPPNNSAGEGGYEHHGEVRRDVAAGGVGACHEQSSVRQGFSACRLSCVLVQGPLKRRTLPLPTAELF